MITRAQHNLLVRKGTYSDLSFTLKNHKIWSQKVGVDIRRRTFALVYVLELHVFLF